MNTSSPAQRALVNSEVLSTHLNTKYGKKYRVTTNTRKSLKNKVTGAGMGSGCGVQRRRRRLAIVRLPIRVQCRFGLETLRRKPTDANDMQQNQTSTSLL